MIIALNPNLWFNASFRASVVLLICTLLFSFTLQYSGVAFAQEKGRVDVLVEGYDGSAVMSVHLIDSGFNFVENKTVDTATFSFTNLTLNEQYLILLYYKEIPYTAEVKVNQTSQQVEIRVYEPTVSDEDIVVEFYHVALTRGEDALNVTEFIQFINLGDKVHDGTELKIAMPEGFKNFRSSHSCCVERTDFGFFFTIPEPIMPNETQTIDLRYQLTPDTDEYTFIKRAYYDTAIAIVTVSSDDLEVVSTENLRSEGKIDIEQQAFDAYSVPDVFAGQGFAITVTGYRTAGLNLLWVGTGVLVVLILGAVAYGLRGTRVSPERLKVEEEALTSVLEELERDFSGGKINEVEYLKLKLKYKTRLEKVKSRIKEYSGVKARG